MQSADECVKEGDEGLNPQVAGSRPIRKVKHCWSEDLEYLLESLETFYIQAKLLWAVVELGLENQSLLFWERWTLKCNPGSF